MEDPFFSNQLYHNHIVDFFDEDLSTALKRRLSSRLSISRRQLQVIFLFSYPIFLDNILSFLQMDKTLVLGDAIKYLKHLQERVKTLEKQATKQTMESVVLVKKSQLLVEDEGSSLDEMAGRTDPEHQQPEIESKVCDKQVLLIV
ncbi:hypothetical protein ACH5RR_001532 [Cinchona calisaya]|uniref:BHLH domain-containing protein n=1 Tax=Cinchona calisaya TaxID=153742 RepID=A0ABD3B436_9GENT